MHARDGGYCKFRCASTTWGYSFCVRGHAREVTENSCASSNSVSSQMSVLSPFQFTILLLQELGGFTYGTVNSFGIYFNWRVAVRTGYIMI